MKKGLLLFFVILSGLFCVLQAQNDTAFWFAPPDLEINHQQTPIRFCITTYEEAATVTFSQPANSGFTPVTFNIPADSFYVYDVSSMVDIMETKPINTVISRGMYITSTTPVSCYYESVGNNSEIYTLKGTNALGTDFLVPMQTQYSNRYSSSTSSIEIIATEDNTVVEITAPVALRGGISAGSTVTVVLQRGQSYSVRADGTTGSAHLHNTVIHSNKPIAVNTTDDSVYANGCYDLIGDQLVPVSMVGTRYIVLRNNSNYEHIFIFPVQNQTTVNINDVTQPVLNAGQWIDYTLPYGITVYYIESDKPVVLFQITATGCELGGTMLPQIECTGSYSVSHLRPNIESMIVTLVTETIHTDDFTLNGNPNAITAADFSPLAQDSSLSYCLKDISGFVPTGTVMKLTNSSGRFLLGILDGNGTGSCSYGFFSDYSRSAYIKFEMDSLFCEGSDIVFNYSAPNVGDLVFTGPNGVQLTTPPFVLSNAHLTMSGWYYLNGIDTSSCFRLLSDSIYIRVAPVSDDTTHLTVTACDSYFWYGDTLTQSGEYMHTITCDSVEILHLTVIPLPELLHTPDTVIFSGTSADLWASGADVLYWTDSSGNILASGPSLMVSPSSSTMYYVTGQNTGAYLSGNTVVNGDFEQGNVEFTSSYNYVYSTSYLLEGCYSVGLNANNYHTGFYSWPDHTTGTGNYMIINGAMTPNTNVWTQTVTVEPNTDYAFSTWVCSVGGNPSSPTEQARLQFSVNGVQLGNIFTAPNAYGVWSRYYEVWNSGNNTSVTLTILNQNTAAGGNDFGIDDITFTPLTECSVTDSIRVLVSGYPDNVDSADCVFFPEGTEWSIGEPVVSGMNASMSASVPLVGDIDDDGQQEIVMHTDSKILIFNSNAELKNQFNMCNTRQESQLALAKVLYAQGEYKTIIVAYSSNNYFYAYDANGQLLWQSNQPFSSYNSESYKMPAISFADFNHDGWTEMFAGSEVYDAATGMFLCKTNGNKGHAGRTWESYGTYQSSAADLFGDASLELAVGNTVYAVDLQSRSDASLNQITPLKTIASANMVMEEGSAIPFTDGNTFLVDINLDGQLDVLVMNEEQNGRVIYLYVWDVVSQSILCSKRIPNARKFGMPQIGDIDSDGFPEICFVIGTYPNHQHGNNETIFALKYNEQNPTGEMDVFWTTPHSDYSGATSLTLFDFNQDGYSELVYRDENHLRIINGSMVHHQTGEAVTAPYDLASYACGSGTALEYPIVCDVDQDGAAEIIIASSCNSSSHNGHLYIFKSAGVPWAPSRKVWNQYMYNVTNVNEDLTIPQYLFNNATVFTDPEGVVRRPFNNFLQQATTIDQYGRTFYAVPDVAMETSAPTMEPSVSSQMVGDSLVLTFSYCNLGDNTLNAPYPITVFANTYGGDTICTVMVGESLPVDSCIQGEIRLSASALCGLPNLNSLLIAVNCNGNGIAQNGGLQPECDTTNNTAAVAVTMHTDTIHLTENACDSYLWHGDTLTQSGEYTHTQTNGNGCDSVEVLTLHVSPFPTAAISGLMVLCEDSAVTLTADSAFSYLWSTGDTTRSIIVTEEGIYTLTVTDEFGCEAVATHQMTLMENPIMSVTVPTICAGETYTLSVDYQFGDYSTAGGPWVTTLSDSLFRIRPPAGLSHDTTIAYTFTVYDTGGCAHDTMVYITVHAIPHVYIDSIVCNSCMWNGALYTQSGSYTYTTEGALCDSIVVLNLIVSPPVTATITGLTSLCSDTAVTLTADSAYSYLWSTGDTTQNISVTEAGTYSVTITNEYGCSAMATHQMTSMGNPNMSVTVPTICAGGTYTLSVDYQFGDYSIAEGSWVTTLSDSLFQITPPAGLSHDTTIAYTFTVYDTGGCTYDTMVYITVHAIPHTEIDTAVCEVLTYGGISYTVSGQYTQTYTNVFGCDSILTLNLNILLPTDSTLVVTVVENNLPYQMNDSSYTTSGTYTQHLDNASGCDSLLTLVLTVLYNVTNTVDTTVCIADLPITWHGQAYTAAGTHTNVLTASNGVDSTVTYTLNVDELSASVGNVTHVVCYGEATGAAMVTVTGGQSPLSYQWTTAAGTGISTTTSISGCVAGSYTFTVTDQLGCTVTVPVTINTLNDSMQPGTIASDQEVCSGNEIEAFTGTSAAGGDNSAYQWQVSTNNTDWTPAPGNNAGQNYTYPDLSNEGFWLRRAWISQSCGTVYSNTVMLTVLPVTHDTITADVCQNIDYQDYGFNIPVSEIEQPGEYVFERIQTTGPCDTFFVLLLTVYPEYSTDISDEICEGGGYFAYGFNIPALATIDVEFLSQTLNLQSVHGCDSTVHLDLSVTDTAIRIIPLATDFCENMSAELMVETAMEDYVWNTGEQVPTITVTKPGIYSVTASQGGCEATAHIQVENCQYELYLPNAITPSKGDGLNDYFSISEYNQLGMDKFEISIFNRWGEQVFYSTDKNFKWNGEYRGQIHHEATYNYIIHYTDLKGKPHKVIGRITVL